MMFLSEACLLLSPVLPEYHFSETTLYYTGIGMIVLDRSRGTAGKGGTIREFRAFRRAIAGNLIG
jgi:hypothetical protein